MKTTRIIYLISTGLLSLLMLMSAGMYFFNTAEVQQTFSNLGYPTYIIIPLAIAKLLGVAAIWLSKSQSLKEWAYAGFFFDFILAFSAHIAANDGQFAIAAVALVLLFTSYFSARKRNQQV